MSTDIVIVSAARTAVGSFSGAFSNIPAHELGAAVIKAALARAKVEAAEVDEVILGQILATGRARTRRARPRRRPAFPRKDRLGHQPAVRLRPAHRRAGNAADRQRRRQHHRRRRHGEHVASQHAAYMRSGVKMGEIKFLDTLLRDGLTDAFHGYHMGVTAENIATKFQITREEQDQFATASQNKAEAAKKSGRFKDEIIPFTISTKKGDIVVDTDEFIRDGVTYDALAKLRPAFGKDGTVTAGNASGINDGAAAIVLMTAAEAARRGLPPSRASPRGRPPASIPRSWERARSQPRARR